MKVFESVSLRVITKPEDSLSLLKEQLQELVPCDWEKDKLLFDESSFTDSFEETRLILELQLTKTRHVNLFTKQLHEKLSDLEKKRIIAELEKQVDEDSKLYLRFDLDVFLAKNELEFTLNGRCVHMQFSVCSHPRRKERAVEVVSEFLS